MRPLDRDCYKPYCGNYKGKAKFNCECWDTVMMDGGRCNEFINYDSLMRERSEIDVDRCRVARGRKE